MNRFHTNEKNQSLNFRIFILWNKYKFRLELITSPSPPKGGVRVGKRETPKLWALERYLKGHGLEIRHRDYKAKRTDFDYAQSPIKVMKL